MRGLSFYTCKQNSIFKCLVKLLVLLRIFRVGEQDILTNGHKKGENTVVSRANESRTSPPVFSRCERRVREKIEKEKREVGIIDLKITFSCNRAIRPKRIVQDINQLIVRTVAPSSGTSKCYNLFLTLETL